MCGSLGKKQTEEEKKRTAPPPQVRTQGGPLINIAPLGEHPRVDRTGGAPPVPVRLTYTGRAGPARQPRANGIAKRKIAGITHAVKQRQGPASLFDGQVTRELRQGQVVTIDERDVFISRRGPNQELFREEDRQKEPRCRWYRLSAVDEVPVPEAEQPSYVRADTLVALEQPLPEWGDAIAPGDRMGTLDPGAGTGEGHDASRPAGRQDARFTNVGALSLGQRQLNRMGRLIWASERAERRGKATPHVAIAFYNGEILVQGNSDRQPIATVPPDRFGKLGNELLPQDEARERQIVRAWTKTTRLFGEDYHPDQVRAEPILRKTQSILRGQDNARLVSDEKTSKKKSKHGEMDLLDRIVREEDERVHREPAPPQRRRLRQLYIGGTLLDCLFCHWAFSIFNQFLAKRYGFYVVTGGTHGQAPTHWVIPQWMRRDDAALEKLRQNLDRYNAALRQKFSPEEAPQYRIEDDSIQATMNFAMTNTIGDNSDSEA